MRDRALHLQECAPTGESKVKNGLHVVLTGLPACGKTSILNQLVARCNAHPIPELVEWIRGRIQLPPQPKTRAEKIAKQELLLSIDIERSRAARTALDETKLVVMDTDFTSALAYNAADKYRSPQLDVFDWLLDQHVEAIATGDLIHPDLYVCLDASIECRRDRSLKDVRYRNAIFFNRAFSERMETYLHSAIADPVAQSRSSCVYIDADRQAEAVTSDVLRAILQHAAQENRTLPLCDSD